MTAEPDWIPHDGGPCPVADGCRVEVRHQDGSVSRPHPAGFWRMPRDCWQWERSMVAPHDIVAYRVVKP